MHTSVLGQKITALPTKWSVNGSLIEFQEEIKGAVCKRAVLANVPSFRLWGGGPGISKFTPATKGVRQKEFGKKANEKSDRNIRKSDQKVAERVPKTRKVIELLLPTSFRGTLKKSWLSSARVALQERLLGENFGTGEHLA